MGSVITALRLRITSHGIGITVFFLWDGGSSRTILVGSGTKMCHALGIKYQKFGHENGISNETTYIVPCHDPGMYYQ